MGPATTRIPYRAPCCAMREEISEIYKTQPHSLYGLKGIKYKMTWFLTSQSENKLITSFYETHLENNQPFVV